MAYTWTTGEVITAGKLNNLEETASSAQTDSVQALQNNLSTQKDLDDLKTLINEKFPEDFGEQIFNVLYPVGTIIMNVDKDYDPNDLFGEWERLDSYYLRSTSDVDSVGEIAGSDTFTLTLDNMPDHNHYIKVISNMYKADEGGTMPALVYNNEKGVATTSSKGNGTAVTHLPRYLSVAAWKRTA